MVSEQFIHNLNWKTSQENRLDDKEEVKRTHHENYEPCICRIYANAKLEVGWQFKLKGCMRRTRTTNVG